MTSPPATSKSSSSTSSPAAPSSVESSFAPSTDLVSTQGKTTIASSVVQKIAGMAAREVSGVYKLGGGAARTFGAIRERIPGSGGPSAAQGVAVEVGETQAAVDIDVVVEYGVSIADLATGIRRNVINSVQRMTGLQVVEVNVSVDDIHLPTDSEEETTESRVQ